MKHLFEVSFGLLPCKVADLGKIDVPMSEIVDFAPDQETEKLIIVHMSSVRECERNPDSDCAGLELADGELFCAKEVDPGWWNVKIRELNSNPHYIVEKKGITKSVLLIITGVILLVLSSSLIIKITLELLSSMDVDKFIIGLFVFAIGTNIPEITIALTSWRNKATEFALSHLIGSAFTNTLMIGILATLKPIKLNIDLAYLLMTIFLGIILSAFLFFCHSNNRLDRNEGIVLLSIYIVFVIFNIWILPI